MKSNLFDFVSIALSGAVLGVCLSNGLGLSFDYELFFRGSDHISQNGFSNLFSEGAFHAKPPLFPLFLSWIENNIRLILWSNMICHVISLTLLISLVNTLFATSPYQYLAKLLLCFAVPTLLIHEFVLPEPLFMSAWSAHLLFVHKTIQKPTLFNLSMITFSAILMIGLRHIGIVPVCLTGSYVWYELRKNDFGRQAILNFLLPLILFFGWQIMLYFQVHHFERLDHFSGGNYSENALEVLVQFSVWFVPKTGVTALNLVSAVFVISTLSYLFILTAKSKAKETSILQFYAILSLTFGAFIIFKGDLIFSDIERYLSIIYFPTVVIFTFGLHHLSNQFPKRQKLILFASYGWLCYPILRLVHNVTLWSGYGG